MKTIVSTDFAECIAEHYGVRMVNVLTGFKFIGEQIGRLEAEGQDYNFILGFEESYGYLTGTYVRDKDGVNAVLAICEMFAYYKTMEKSLTEVLDDLYKTYGYILNTLHSYKFEGADGFHKMQRIMKTLRQRKKEIAGRKILGIEDYLTGQRYIPETDHWVRFRDKECPASDVVRVQLENQCTWIVRPSGTEPKLKVYISVCAEDEKMTKEIEKEMVELINKEIELYATRN